MPGVEDTVAALQAAFNALLAQAEPTRRVAALRIALKALLDDEASPPSRPSRPRAPPLANGENLLPWPELRDRLRAQMERDRIATAKVAAAIGITRQYCTRLLCPSGTRPGPQVCAALEEWLNARSGPGKDAAEPNAESEPEIIDPNRLTLAQRERLAATLQFDPKSLRIAGATVEIAEQAVSGQNLDPASLERLSVFLDGPIPGRASTRDPHRTEEVRQLRKFSNHLKEVGSAGSAM